MNETLTNFRQAVADSTDLQPTTLWHSAKKTNELETGWEELQQSDEELTAFELVDDELLTNNPKTNERKDKSR